MLLTDFYLIIDKLLESAVMVYTVSNNAILIDDPEVSLFAMAFGFIVLEVFLSWILFFRPGASGNEQEQANNYKYKARRHKRDY
jgi:hypothetical protein